ncbi:MAG: hypothetical protein HS111_34050 [Kofleriaceae bacterium]|nr:hypothetical protein [Kofleriaceae bacterium]
MAALGVGLILLLRGGAWSPRGGAPPVQVAALDPATSAGAAPDREAAPRRPALDHVDVDTMITADRPAPELGLDDRQLGQAALARLEHTRQVYRDTMRYPEWSRPADGSTRHLVAWNQVDRRTQPFTRSEDGRDLHGELRLDRMFAGPGESITATVEVFLADGDMRVPVAASVVGELQMVGPDDFWVTVATIPFAPAGAAGAGWVARFEPDKVAELAAAPRDVQLVAWVTAGDHTFPFESPFRYSATRVFEVVDWVGDRIVDGSLEVELSVDVKSLDPVRITATLFDASGQRPIAIYDDYLRPTRPGRQAVRLTFFGKALREAGLDGPYRLGALHGFVKLFEGDLAERFWSHPDDPRFVTRPYRAHEFSAADWSDDATRARLELYRQLERDLRAPGGSR